MTRGVTQVGSVRGDKPNNALSVDNKRIISRRVASRHDRNEAEREAPLIPPPQGRVESGGRSGMLWPARPARLWSVDCGAPGSSSNTGAPPALSRASWLDRADESGWLESLCQIVSRSGYNYHSDRLTARIFSGGCNSVRFTSKKQKFAFFRKDSSRIGYVCKSLGSASPHLSESSSRQETLAASWPVPYALVGITHINRTQSSRAKNLYGG
ncbi:hypothetical protein RRG08_066230 [Elysia crispata]|uniref:Uncharacterized protein n=1 Tax=Elysia crispata TaxID=231223 RepID=A0AAE1BCY0_9GAST|nr:hypothetical protein RRG08_066230 [Elysia crispata]